MKNSTFFSGLIAFVGISYWGFITPFGGSSESLPYVGLILDSNIEKITKSKKTSSIPKVIDPSNIQSEYDNLPCAKKIFPNISKWESLSDDELSAEISIENQSALNGCLSVWWNKEESNEQTKVGNVLWSMSDGNQGTIFLSKITLVNNRFSNRTNERLIFLKNKGEEGGWEILIDNSQTEESEEDIQSEDSDELGSKWKTQEAAEATGKLNWEFALEDQTQDEPGILSEKIDELSKWLGDSELFKKASDKYEKFGGSFKQIKE